MRRPILFALLCLVPLACTSSRLTESPVPESSVQFTILQINDVYEITAVGGGKEGGIARLATLRKSLLQENPQTWMMIAGDFFSPSALGTARVNGERLAGEQMVDVLNAAGLDYATFGNHEFDVREADFYKRLDESAFTWVSSNVVDDEGNLFPGSTKTATWDAVGMNGTRIKIGLFGVTLPSNPKDYVQYEDAFESAVDAVNQLRDHVDVVLGLTHLPLEEDMRLAAEVPGIHLIMGGHEHENVEVRRGPHFVPVTKADANVRSAYVHRFTVNPADKKVHIESDWVKLDESIDEDPAVASVVKMWVDKGFAGFRESGFEPERITAHSTENLDGLEASVRNFPTRLTEIIGQSLLLAAEEAELSFFNSGSVRIDDVLPPGPISEYDVIRVLPFGGEIALVSLSGSLLRQILDQGEASKGKGAYLHTTNVENTAEGWLVNGTSIVDSATYKAAVTDFLLTGLEEGMGFFTPENPGLSVLGMKMDVRKALILQLEKTYPN